MPVYPVTSEPVGMRLGVSQPGSVGGASFAASVLALSPLVYWKLDEPSGLTATDSSVNARNGTYGSGVTLNQASLLTHGTGTSASFGNTLNAKVTSTYNPFVGDLTFGCWVNPTNFTGQIPIFGGSGGTQPDLILANATGQPIWFSDLGAASVAWTAGDIPAATNSFVVLTWNNTTKVSELFVNAVSKTQKTSVNSFNAAPGTLTYGFDTAGGIGFRGKLDDFFVISGVLSGAQITTLFNAA